MKAYILNIGNEVLSGKVINTNASYLAFECEKLGIETIKIIVVGDQAKDIETSVIEFLKSDASLLITTGGLGPTHDDITKEVIAKVCHLNMVYNQQAALDMATYFGEIKNDCNIKQSYFPQGARILQNLVGSADGAFIHYQNKDICMLVGPREELKQMFEKQVKPILSQQKSQFVFQDYYVMGNTESYFETLLQPLFNQYSRISISPYASYGLIRFRIQSLYKDNQEFESCKNDFEKIMMEYIISKTTDRIEEIVVEQLKKIGWKIGCAESITGGLITQMLTSIPGASEIINSSIIPYQEQAKIQLLGIHPEMIQNYGVVSEEIAIEMVRGLWKKTTLQLAIAITGYAGPTGDEIGKVCFAIKTSTTEIAKTIRLHGNREMIRIRAARQVLFEVYLLLKKIILEGIYEGK